MNSKKIKKLTIKSGNLENDNYRRCQQTKCGYYIGVTGSCKKCKSCNSSSFILKKDCHTCLDCEGVSGSLRWGEDNIEQDEVVAQIILTPEEEFFEEEIMPMMEIGNDQY